MFCTKCGAKLPEGTTTCTNSHDNLPAKKKVSRAAIWTLAAPFISLFAIVFLWGVLGFISRLTDSVDGVVRIVDVLLPIIITLNIMAIPVCVIVTIVTWRK